MRVRLSIRAEQGKLRVRAQDSGEVLHQSCSCAGEQYEVEDLRHDAAASSDGIMDTSAQ